MLRRPRLDVDRNPGRIDDDMIQKNHSGNQEWFTLYINKIIARGATVILLVKIVPLFELEFVREGVVRL